MIADPLGDAVEWVRGGSLLVYPTETVWGLGADARSDAAVGRLLDWKGRGTDAPVSILVANPNRLDELGFEVGSAAQRLILAFWPGPVTLVLPCRERFARGVMGPSGAVGVRCSSHPLAAALARRLDAEGVGPLTATSLNPSGAVPATTLAQARALCRDGEPGPRMLEVEGAEAGGDQESTVVDATEDRPRVRREGAVTREDVDRILDERVTA